MKYSDSINISALRSPYNNLERNEGKAPAVDATIRAVKQDGWREHAIKRRMVWRAIKKVLDGGSGEADGFWRWRKSMPIIKKHHLTFTLYIHPLACCL